MSSERKITTDDAPMLTERMERKLKQLKRRNPKLWFQYIDIPSTVNFLLTRTEAYIVDNAYLVAYCITSPWYACDEIVMLEEILVLRLERGGDFSAVPAFLERKALEAGAKLACVGTALARADAALASFYQKAGFSPATTLLVKDTSHG